MKLKYRLTPAIRGCCCQALDRCRSCKGKSKTLPLSVKEQRGLLGNGTGPPNRQPQKQDRPVAKRPGQRDDVCAGEEQGRDRWLLGVGGRAAGKGRLGQCGAGQRRREGWGQGKGGVKMKFLPQTRG